MKRNRFARSLFFILHPFDHSSRRAADWHDFAEIDHLVDIPADGMAFESAVLAINSHQDAASSGRALSKSLFR